MSIVMCEEENFGLVVRAIVVTLVHGRLVLMHEKVR